MGYPYPYVFLMCFFGALELGILGLQRPEALKLRWAHGAFRAVAFLAP